MVYNRNRLNLKFWVQGIYVFVVFVLIAFLMNVSVYNILASLGIYETFNMFFIGPYYPCSLPLLSLIYPLVPYVVFLLIYVLGFTFISYLVYIVESNIYKACLKRSNYESKKSN